MATPHRPPARPSAAGGFLIAIGAMIGSVIGLFLGQPTLGFLGGVGLGIAISLAMLLRDRAR